MNYQARTLVPLALAGGQGKTTIALMTGRLLAKYGVPVLFIDADPQASLTKFLGVDLSEDRPTLLEVLTKTASKVPLYSAIHPVPENDNLFIIPASDELEDANHSLAASPMGLNVLRNRLYQFGEKVSADEQVVANFGFVIVDPPPERSHLALTSLGCADYWVIAGEANIKGVESLIRTKKLLETCQPLIPHGEFLGVVPFRAKWVGLNPTSTTKESIQAMCDIAGADKMLPHILDSDKYTRAINEQRLPSELGAPGLEYPLLTIIDRIKTAMGPYRKQIEDATREVVLQ